MYEDRVLDFLINGCVHFGWLRFEYRQRLAVDKWREWLTDEWRFVEPDTHRLLQRLPVLQAEQPVQAIVAIQGRVARRNPEDEVEEPVAIGALLKGLAPNHLRTRCRINEFCDQLPNLAPRRPSF
jgi:hypothetical protein